MLGFNQWKFSSVFYWFLVDLGFKIISELSWSVIGFSWFCCTELALTLGLVPLLPSHQLSQVQT
jgi:hypothetical protein